MGVKTIGRRYDLIFARRKSTSDTSPSEKHRLESHRHRQWDTVYTRPGLLATRNRARNFGKIESLSESVSNCATCAILPALSSATRLSALAAIQMQRVARIAEEARRAQRPGLYERARRTRELRYKAAGRKKLASRNYAVKNYDMNFW